MDRVLSDTKVKRRESLLLADTALQRHRLHTLEEQPLYTAFQKHIDRLWNEVDEALQARRLMPTLQKEMAKLPKFRFNLRPLVLSAFGFLLGSQVCGTGVIVTLIIMVKMHGVGWGNQNNFQKYLTNPAMYATGVLTYHSVWLVLKLAFWGLASIVPWNGYYHVFTFLILAGVVALTPPEAHLLPIFAVSEQIHSYVCTWVDWVLSLVRDDRVTRDISCLHSLSRLIRASLAHITWRGTV